MSAALRSRRLTPVVAGAVLSSLLVIGSAAASATDERTVSATVAENETLSLQAPSGSTFTSVVFASYGTPEGASQGWCHSATSVARVTEAFIGRSSGQIQASNGVFGDPCYGTFKRLTVVLAYSFDSEPGQSPSPTDTPAHSIKLVVNSFACALLSNASARCWGSAAPGSIEPPDLRGSEFRDIAVGAVSACGVLVSGRIRCWGRNDYGQMNAPAWVSDAVAIAGWNVDYCALRANQQVVCWGWNDWGQTSPSQPTGTVAHMSIGRSMGCTSDTEGVLQCWGGPHYGPAPVGMGVLRDLSIGEFAACAVDSGGRAHCWSRYGNDSYIAPPADLPELTRISVAVHGICALDTQGRLHCWGYANASAYAASLRRVIDFAQGDTWGCSQDIAWQVTCWGQNSNAFAVPAEVNGVQRTAPQPPVNVVARPLNRAVAVSWQPPAGVADPVVSGYTVTVQPGGRTCDTTELQCVISGLRSNQTYSVTVVAQNAIGNSHPSTSAYVNLTRSVTVSSVVTSKGADAVVSGTAFEPGAAVDVWVDGRKLTDRVADAEGAVTANFMVPRVGVLSVGFCSLGTCTLTRLYAPSVSYKTRVKGSSTAVFPVRLLSLPAGTTVRGSFGATNVSTIVDSRGWAQLNIVAGRDPRTSLVEIWAGDVVVARFLGTVY